MDSISPVDAINGLQNADSLQSIKVPYGAALAENVEAFNASMESASGQYQLNSEGVSELAKAAFKPLDYIDQEAQNLGDYAKNAVESGNSLTPGEIVNLTVQSQKFMFHSQLVANIANRSADGIQQLFRQQG